MAECPLTELDTTACACKNCRNLTLVEEEKWDCHGPFAALYQGTCARCKNQFHQSDRIARTIATQVYIHAVCARNLNR